MVKLIIEVLWDKCLKIKVDALILLRSENHFKDDYTSSWTLWIVFHSCAIELKTINVVD